jgi:hypothetical protein
VRDRRHRATALGAPATRLDAETHHVVAAVDGLTRLGAPFTCVCADAANGAVKARRSEHEIARRIAELRAIEQGCDVVGCRVLASDPEAVRECLDARIVTVGAVLDAVPHLRREVPGDQVMCHGGPRLLVVFIGSPYA